MMEQHRRDVARSTAESVDSDQDVDAKQAPEQTCEVGMNGECLNMEEKDMFEESFEAVKDVQPAEVMPEKDMFEEKFETVKDTQTEK
jgi:hypothetical protein